jgi:hypothetical protein
LSFRLTLGLLPEAYADDLKLFCKKIRNPVLLLEKIGPKDYYSSKLAKDGDKCDS